MSLEQKSLSEQEVESVMQAFEHEGASVRASLRYLMKEKEIIAAGLLLCLSFLKGQKIKGVIVQEFQKVEPAKFNQGLIDFQLLCSIEQTAINVGIVVLTESSDTEVCTALNRLFSYKDFGLNRLCILRSATVIDSDPQLQNNLSRLLSPEIGGSLIDLRMNALEMILTILFVFRGRHKYSIDASSLVNYIQQANILPNNSIIRDLLISQVDY
jgi:hypothetical protein